MSDELKHLGRLAASGRLDRRAFLARAAALGVAMPFASTLLSSAAKASEPVKGGVMRVGLGGGQSTDSLDPALAASEAPNALLSMFGERLLEVTPDGGIAHRIAEEYSSSPDAKVWTFKIRSGVTFHDGKPLTAEDVVATMRRHADKNSKSAALGLMSGIEALSAEGDKFVVTLKDPNADLPYVMADYHLVIQPGGGVDNPASGVAAGPYKVVTQESGVRYVFEKYADYWDSTRGHVDRIEVLIINDDMARVAAIQSGQVHMINRVPPKIAGMIGQVPTVRLKSVPSRGHYVFIMQTNQAPFDNKDVRLALKYAINREEMVEKVLFGHGTVGNDMPINAASPLFSDDIEQRAYDPEKAAFHFKKSGHQGPITLHTAETAFPGAVDAAQLFQNSAAATGITIDVKRHPNDGYWSEVWNVLPFCASYWNGRPTQDMIYSTVYMSGAEWNETRYANPDLDKAIVAARGELDPEKRKALYREIGLTIRDDGGLICPMFSNFVDAVSDKVEGWTDDPNFPLMNALAPVKCWLTA